MCVYFSASGTAAAPPGLVENCTDRDKEEGLRKDKKEECIISFNYGCLTRNQDANSDL